VSGLAVFLYQTNQPVQRQIMEEAMAPKPEPLTEQEVRKDFEAKPDAMVADLPPGKQAVNKRKMASGIEEFKDECNDEETSQPLKQERAEEDSFIAGVGDVAEMETIGQSAPERFRAEKRSSAAVVPSTPSSRELPPADYEVAFTPAISQEGEGKFRQNLDDLVRRVGGRYLGDDEDSGVLSSKDDSNVENLLLTIPRAEYNRFKTGLNSLGTIESESGISQRPSTSFAAERNMADASLSVRIRLTIRRPDM
jgi:hypothetical protein